LQAQKVAGTPHAERIGQARTPAEAAPIGRDRHLPLRPDWDAVKDNVMRRAVLHKFASHDDLRAVVLATGDDLLVEQAPRDASWGCGADGRGQNKLGQILMEVRATLQQAKMTASGERVSVRRATSGGVCGRRRPPAGPVPRSGDDGPAVRRVAGCP